MPLLSEVMKEVTLGGNNASRVLYFQSIDMQVQLSLTMSLPILIMHHAGERCQRTSLHFRQHLHHSCHPVRQLMGCRCHTEKRKDADTHNNCLRLCRQCHLQPAHCLLPVRHAKCRNIYLCTLFALEMLATKLRKNRNKH